MTAIGLIEDVPGGFRLSRRPIKSFGETLEWFVAEIFKREFSTEAIWGIRFKRPKVGGDYDIIAKVDGSILYMEVKSSPPKQIYQNEIAAFFDRVTDLSPEISIFFVDTELRMKDKIVLMFEEELKRRHESPPKVVRMEKELFQTSGQDIHHKLQRQHRREYRKGDELVFQEEPVRSGVSPDESCSAYYVIRYIVL